MGRKLDQLIEIFCCGSRQQKDKRPLPTRMSAAPAAPPLTSARVPLSPSALAAQKAARRPNAFDTSEGWMANHVIVDRPRGPAKKEVNINLPYNTCHAKIDTTPIRVPRPVPGRIRDDDRAPTNRMMDWPWTKLDDTPSTTTYEVNDLMPGGFPSSFDRSSPWARLTAN